MGAKFVSSNRHSAMMSNPIGHAFIRDVFEGRIGLDSSMGNLLRGRVFVQYYFARSIIGFIRKDLSDIRDDVYVIVSVTVIIAAANFLTSTQTVVCSALHQVRSRELQEGRLMLTAPIVAPQPFGICCFLDAQSSL